MNGWFTAAYRGSMVESNLDPQDSSKSNENIRINRNDEIEKILSNKYEGSFGVASVIYCILSVAFCVLSTISITTWPQHQSIGQPQYWWESLALNVFSQAFIGAQGLVFPSYYSLCIGIGETGKTCFVIWFCTAFTMFVTAYHISIFWVFVGGYEWPMPFQGYIVMCIGWWGTIASFWLHSKLKWKSDSIVRRKIIWGIVFINVTYVGLMTYQGVQVLFVSVDERYHFPLVFVILLVRELHVRGLSYVGKKINGGQDLALEIDAVHLGAIRHILFLSVNLGSMTTENISYTILASDFIINLIDCFVIIWYHRKGDEASEKKKMRALITLISNEATEFILPISYACVLLLSYYGPNAEIMGNIKNSSWQYSAIEDISDTLFWLVVMFLVDSISTATSLLLLWMFCNVNILKMYSQILNHMGYLLAVQTAYYVTEVSFVLR